MTTDEKTLADLNERFIDAFRQGSWETLEPILSPRFRYLDGGTGEIWSMERYIDNLRGHGSPELTIDELAIHVADDAAVVSARTSRGTGHYNRYVDTYERADGSWRCIHACVWSLQ